MFKSLLEVLVSGCSQASMIDDHDRIGCLVSFLEKQYSSRDYSKSDDSSPLVLLRFPDLWKIRKRCESEY